MTTFNPYTAGPTFDIVSYHQAREKSEGARSTCCPGPALTSLLPPPQCARIPSSWCGGGWRARARGFFRRLIATVQLAYERTVELLGVAGYFRVRLPGLSPFDKVLGGLAWAISASAVDVDVDVFFDDDATLGEKNARAEDVCRALVRMKCPHALRSFQITRCDWRSVQPVVTWLIRTVLETRDETAQRLRTHALCEYRRAEGLTLLAEDRSRDALRVQLDARCGLLSVRFVCASHAGTATVPSVACASARPRPPRARRTACSTCFVSTATRLRRAQRRPSSTRATTRSPWRPPRCQGRWWVASWACNRTRCATTAASTKSRRRSRTVRREQQLEATR